MPVRTSMSALIAKTRLMIFDQGGSPMFADQDIQDELDQPMCRRDIRYEMLQPKPTFSNVGGILYNDYYASRGWWEADEVLIWGDFHTLTPLTSDEIVGHWTFSNQLPPILLAGKRYDLNRAAANLLEYKIANLAGSGQLDFTADGQTFHLSQQIAFLEKRVCDYRRKQEARIGGGGREDAPETLPLGVAPGQAALAGDVSATVPFLTGE